MPITLTISDELKLSSRTTVLAGDFVKVKGRKGEFMFRRHVLTDRGKEWVDLLCSDQKTHSVRPDEVKKKPTKRSK